MRHARRARVRGFARWLVALAGVFAAGLWLWAAAGDLDTSFGTSGLARTDIRTALTGSGTSSDEGVAVVVQSDGKLLAAGHATLPTGGGDVALARYTRDGRLDTTYGTNGVVVTDVSAGSSDAPVAAALQADGKCVVVGDVYISGQGQKVFLLRYGQDGALDSTFGDAGKAWATATNWYPSAMAIQPSDGKIVVVGTGAQVIRFNSDGSPDTTFPNGALAGIVEALGVAVQDDGRIVVAGWQWSGAGDEQWDLVVVRLLSNGTADGTFGTAGRVTTNIGWTDAPGVVTVQPDGKIIVGLIIRSTEAAGLDFGLARYTTSGALDTTFGTGGTVVTDLSSRDDFLRGVALEADGHVVAAGGSRNLSGTNDFAIARYDSTGHLDASFGTGGIVATAVASSMNGGLGVAVQAPGKVVVVGGGASDFVLARYGTTTVTADLAISSVVASPSPDVFTGSTLTYTINFVSNGPATASRATVKDTVPANTTFVSSRVVSGSGWQLVSAPAVGGTGDVIWAKSMPGPAASETAQFEMVVTVAAATSHGTTVSNTATTYAGDPVTLDPDPANNAITTTRRAIIVVDPLEPNDTSGTAATLQLGTTTDLVHTEGVSSDVDWYKFYVPPEAAGQDVRVNVRITSTYPDPIPANWRSDIDFMLYDGALALRGLAYSPSDNETLYIHAAAAGWYYVFVGYCTVTYAGEANYAHYAITLESGNPSGMGYITGRLVDSHGQGIEQVYVRVSPVPANSFASYPIITSGAGGYFSVVATPGPHTLLFQGNLQDSGPTVNIVETAYPGQVTVAEGQVTGLGDIPIAIGAIVTGKVTNGSSAPLSRALVTAYDATGASKGYVYTDASGDYTLAGVPVSARLRFSKSGYAAEYYDDKPSFAAATLCATQPGETLSGINAQLNPGGTVSGTVRNASAAPLLVTVRLYSVTDSTVYYSSTVSLEATGAYAFSGVRPGNYKVLFSPFSSTWGYAPRWYSNGASNAFASVITVAQGATTSGIDGVLRRPADRDGDGKADISVYRPASGTWFSLDSSASNASYRYRGWGVQAEQDHPVVGDFDGDGILDPTVVRPAAGTWFILTSSSNFTDWQWFGWGNATDVLVPGDYDGDRKTDAAVFRPSTGTWYIRPSGGGAQWSVAFGAAGDVPVAGDFDGDGIRDPAVYRPASGTWFWLKSSSNFTAFDYRGWGVQAEGDVPVPGDYDGDGRTDLCIFRPASGTWFVLQSSTDYATWAYFGWGVSTDTLMPADYDGDGKTDAAVYRPSTGAWFVRPSGGAASWTVVFGESGDVPLLGGR
jgi:uncharacterized delta-60 repeat protein/uncharacterized repeat protein (TIGR01451 family)